MSSPMITEAEGQVNVKKVLSVIFFGVTSLMFTVVNKTVLTAYYFPSFQVLRLGQMALTMIVLWIGSSLKLLQFPALHSDVTRRIWPLPLLFLGNMATSLRSTEEINLPMFAAMKRLSIFMTMVLEKRFIEIQVSCAGQTCVIAMVTGALLAAIDDWSLPWSSYILVLLNDAFSATNGVYVKKLLDAKDFSIYGLMFYDSFFTFLPALFVSWITDDLTEVINCVLWNDLLFTANFILSCVMGVILSYSSMVCTHYNSALTTNIIGTFKNIIVIYLGMVIDQDFIVTWLNFIGLNICIMASLAYSYITFKQTPVLVYSLVKNENVEI